MVIDGKKIAEELLSELKKKPIPQKFLAGVLIGKDLASESFQKLKEETAKKLGVDYRIYHLSDAESSDALRDEVGRIAMQKTCGGILVQLPIPAHLNKQYILNAIPKEKDVDVLGERAMGAFYADRGVILPPSVATVEEILKRVKFDLVGKTAAVVGPGFLIGRPIALWLMNRVRELFVLRRGSDYGVLKNADLVISGAGVAGLLKPEMLKHGAGVIDFSYSQNENQKLVGDLDVSALEAGALSFYTPTPGGTGPILVAKLLENCYTLNTLRS